MLTRLTELLGTHNVFVRGRKPNWLRSLGIALLFHGLSCRKTAGVLCFFDEASYEAARQWYHCAQKLLSAPQKRYRPTVAIDETKIKVKETWYYLWAAVDTENREGAARCRNHADSRRPRCVSLHTTGVTDVYERIRRRCSWTVGRGIHGR